MADEKLTPERAIQLLRAKAGELEAQVKAEWDTAMYVDTLRADIALIAGLLADHIERQDSTLALYVAHLANLIERVYALEGGDPDLTTVTVQHDASFNPLGVQLPGESPVTEWTAGDARLADCQFRWENTDDEHTHACVKGGTHGGEHVCECGQKHRGLVIPKWHAGDPPGPGEPGDASDAT